MKGFKINSKEVWKKRIDNKSEVYASVRKLSQKILLILNVIIMTNNHNFDNDVLVTNLWNS